MKSTVTALMALPLFLATFLAPGSDARVVRTSVSCTMMADPEECDLCVENKDRRLNECEEKARSRFSRAVHFRPSRYPEFTWTIDNSTFDESEDLSMTLFAWDATENAHDPGYPIPGCCGVPVKEGRCRASICRKGHVFYRLVTDSCEYYAARPVVPRHMQCSGDRDVREVARFLYLCPEKRTAWMSQLNCECIKYDTMTGDFMPTNDSQPWESLSYNVWLNLHRDSMSQRYSHLCMFTLPKAEVMREGKMSDSNSSKESFLFQRGVYDMPQRHWVNGSVLGLDGGTTVSCNAWKYNGSSVFELTSSTPDNDTFTCLVMWPNGTDQLRPFASHVKCMPPNATYVPFDSKSVFSEEKARNDAMARTLIGIVGGAGALVVLAVVLFFAWKCNRKLKVYLKKTKAIPEHMDPIVDKKSCVAATAASNVVEREKADLLVYSARGSQEGFPRNNFSTQSPDMTSSDPRYDVFFSATSSSSRDVRASDKRIQRDDEYSDSEDEGEGGRKNAESHRKKKRKLEEGDGKPAAEKTEDEKPASKVDPALKSDAPPSDAAPNKEEEKMDTQPAEDANIKRDVKVDIKSEPKAETQTEAAKTDAPAAKLTDTVEQASANKDGEDTVKPSNEEEKMEQ